MWRSGDEVVRYVISFPVINKVLAVDKFPVRDEDCTFFVESSDLLMTRVGIIFDSIEQSLAPQMIDLQPKGEVSARNPAFELRAGNGPFRALAISRIRAWQAVMAPYSVINVDFSRPTEEYTPADGESVDIFKYSLSKRDSVTGVRDFTIYARAFLASRSCFDLIEAATFYLEADSAAIEGRHVQAYNSYYLILESIFANGKFTERDVVRELISNQDFIASLRAGLDDAISLMPRRRNPAPFGLSSFEDLERVITSIVKLRGKLRHHSSKNKNRWNPVEQGRYQDETFVLANVCRHVINARSQEDLWSEASMRNVMSQAHQSGVKMVCAIEITVSDGGRLSVVKAPDISFPASLITSDLSLAALEKALQFIREKLPVSQVSCFRCYDKRNGVEIFRYSFSGVTIPD